MNAVDRMIRDALEYLADKRFGVICAKNTRNRDVVKEMMVDPSEPLYWRRLQTAECGFLRKRVVVNDSVKRRDKLVRYGLRR